MQVLMVTTEFPEPGRPGGGCFILRQVEALRSRGVGVDVLAFRSGGSVTNHFCAWRRLRQMISKTRYDLIHAQFGHAALVARTQWRLPVVVTYRGSDVLGIVGPGGRYTLKGSILILFSKAISMCVEAVIVVAESIGRRLPRRDYVVIPSGVELERFRPIPREKARSILGWSMDELVVLFVALNLDDPVKRYALADATVALVRKKLNKDVQFRVVTGVTPDDIALYMNASDALLLTSSHEGSPNVVKEALACNLPVVSVDVGDVRERLADVQQCFVCDPIPEALASALCDVLTSGQRANGREKVGELDETLLALRVIEVYRKVLRGCGPRGLVKRCANKS